MFQHILIGLDGSPLAETILMWTASFAVFALTTSLVGSALALNGLLAVRATNPPVRQLRLVRGTSDYGEFTDFLDRAATTLLWRSLSITFAVVCGLVLG